MKEPIFTGSATALVTPFTETGVDYEKFKQLLDFQYANGTSAVIISGTTGECCTQPVEEHAALIDFACKYVAGRMKVIAGVGSNCTVSAYELARCAEDSGADGILMVTPYYNKSTQRGLISHFTYVADRIGIPIILYNVPSRTGIGFQADTYKALSSHPNINGIKEASGNFSLLSRTRYLCGDDLWVWNGNDDDTLGMMALGAIGVISVASNIVPRAIADLCAQCLAGDFTAARATHMKYADLFSRLFIETNPIPIKTAMNLLGWNVGKLRLPLVDMAPENLELLKASLINVGLELK